MQPKDHDPNRATRPGMPWPDFLSQLKRTFEDDTVDQFRREHAYFTYWYHIIRWQKRSLSRSDLRTILRHKEWVHSAQSILIEACQVSALSRRNAEWLMEEWGANPFIKRHLKAYLVLEHAPGDTEARLKALLDLDVKWATKMYIRNLPAEEKGTAERLIGTSGLSKRQQEIMLGVRDH